MTVQEEAAAAPRGNGQPLVKLTGVQKHFGELHALKDIELTVTKGEVVVVIGPSGSGKSTLCRTINRLETIDKGTDPQAAVTAACAGRCRAPPSVHGSRCSAPRSCTKG